MRRRRDALMLVAPLVLFLGLWLGFPFLTNLVYSVSQVNFETLRAPSFIGLDNYARAIQDPAFWGAMGFSLHFAVAATLAQVLLGLVIALALRPLLVRHKALMALILLPLMISPALIGVMYRLILNEFVGVVPQYLAVVGLYPNLLGPDWVFATVVAIEVLQWTPFAILLLFTALQSIPTELYDAARVDGAGPWQCFWRITLPLLVPGLAITGFVRFIDSFRVFDHIFVLTGGGPGSLTTSVSIYIYRSFFQQQQLGSAVATSMVLLVLSLAALYASMRLMLRKGEA